MLGVGGPLVELALSGRLERDELRRWLRPAGIGEQAAVLVFSLPDPHAGVEALESCLGEAGARGLVGVHRGLLCAIVECDEPVEVARSARDALRERFGEGVRAAASRTFDTALAQHGFQEASCALEAARNANGEAFDVACYDDLGALKLLLCLPSREALESYCRAVLGPLQADSRSYGEELLRSADAFIEHNGHWEQAAQALYCHRHTLRYRIRRVEALTKRDLSCARDRIELWLALRGRELLR